jgi:BirA family biotin operon repressor/biotin-[acetyl-CoA-carboxylase] ligase
MAVEQSAGRGQQKRQWVSPAGNLHASWRWPLPPGDDGLEPKWSGLMSLMAGFILARGLGQLGVAAKIKWPNDLLLHDPASGMDRKFGGILSEMREGCVVVGCGINIGYCPDDRQLREESAVAATRLADQDANLSPLALWTTLVEQGKPLFENLMEFATPGEFVRMMETKMAWIGRTVLIRKTNRDVFEAKILGLAEDGGLRIKTGNTADVLYSGGILPLY